MAKWVIHSIVISFFQYGSSKKILIKLDIAIVTGKMKNGGKKRDVVSESQQSINESLAKIGC